MHLQSPTQKLEDIIKGLDLWKTHRTYDYLYPFSPETEGKASESCQNLIILLNKIDQIQDKPKMIERIKGCMYSVTSSEQDLTAPSMEDQEEAFAVCKKTYYVIIDEIHKLITGR